MKTYLIVADDDDGDSLDLVVVAASPVLALDYWRAYYHFDDDEDDTYDGPFVAGYPDPLIRNLSSYAKVFEIQSNGVVGALPWTFDGIEKHPAGQTVLVGHVLCNS